MFKYNISKCGVINSRKYNSKISKLPLNFSNSLHMCLSCFNTCIKYDRLINCQATAIITKMELHFPPPSFHLMNFTRHKRGFMPMPSKT